MSRETPALSVVIPTLEEERTLGALLGDLRALPVPHEVIVADGGSADATVAIARAQGALVVQAPAGRGSQLRAGAARARAGVFCFLHADVRLDAGAVAALEIAVRHASRAALVFDLRIDAPGAAFRLIELAVGARTRVLRLPYGDQGLVVSRVAYDAAGGYADVPLMEDVALIRALRRVVPIRVLPASLTISPRRWQREGIAARTVRNWILLARYLLGTPPATLARAYPAHGAARAGDHPSSGA